MNDELKSQMERMEKSVDAAKRALLEKHGGPGPHKNGTTQQQAHGRKGGMRGATSVKPAAQGRGWISDDEANKISGRSVKDWSDDEIDKMAHYSSRGNRKAYRELKRGFTNNRKTYNSSGYKKMAEQQKQESRNRIDEYRTRIKDKPGEQVFLNQWRDKHKKLYGEDY